MKKSLLVGRFVIAIVFVFYASLCFAQDDVGEVFNTLTQSSKIIESDLVLDDFKDGNETTRVIVTLIEPAGFQQTREFVSSSTDNSRSFKNLVFRDELRDAVQAAQEHAIGSLDPGKVQITNRFVYIFGFSAEVTLEGLKELEELDEVVSISKDRILQAHLAQGIPLMNASTVRSTYNGSGMAIAICDTGIDYTHARLGGGGFPNSKVIGGRDVGDDDTDPMDAQGHGTSCAGIAAGDLGTVGDYIGGVAYNAKLYAVKISTGTTGGASESNMIEGWEWCITHQNDDPSNPIMIISTSFGGGYYLSSCDSASPLMTTAAANCVAMGMTLFVSSGNDTYTDGMGWPACISHVNSVGAVYDADVGYKAFSVCTDTTTAPDQVTCYSNSASFLTLFAPSNDAYTTAIGGGYTPTFGGTSAACPYAAGAAAGLQSAAQDSTGSFLTPAEVKSSFTSTGDLVTDPKVPSITKPRINLQAAVDALGGSPGGDELDELALDFGPAGLWDYDGTTWTKISASSPEDMAGWSGGLAMDYGASGLWNYDVTTNVLWDNGPLVNSPGTGAGGADESMLQNNSLGMNTLGFGHQKLSSYRVADDFTVSGAGWQIDSITFFAYQTGSTTTSTMTEVNYNIWDGSPDDPSSSIVFSDTVALTTGANTAWSNIYRVTETTSGDTGRPIMENTVNPGIFLPPGTYWLDWQTDGTLSSGPWAPPITINGQTITGNALQFTTAWDPAIDSGSVTQQGFPFIMGEGGHSVWTRISGSSPEDMTDWANGLAMDYGGLGLWNYDGTTWMKISASSPEGMTGWANGLAMDFGVLGLWNFDGTTWMKISGSSPEDMTGWANGLAMDFGGLGLWNFDGTTWMKISGSSPECMTGWTDGLAMDFGVLGLWNFDGTTWMKISGSSPEGVTGWANGLAMDYGGVGLWNFDGTTWMKISSSDVEDMDDVDLF